MLTWNDLLDRARHGNPMAERRVQLDEAAWRERLSPEQFQITRLGATERPFSSPMCAAFEAGIYRCVGCASELFDASVKFESNSGWPSFTQPLRDNAIAYRLDTSHGMFRIETLCNVCDAHLGHAFPDGPPPCGLRFCINALALEKVPHTS